ncbi:mitochondrial 37S ribosomal protein rsm10 [Dispira simplex]|nr:mitochondrial 37S ribosomal protein rsm10 [Dispira simplex]
MLRRTRSGPTAILEALDRSLKVNQFKAQTAQPKPVIPDTLQPAKSVPPTLGLVSCNLHLEAFSDHRIDFYTGFIRKVAQTMQIPCSNAVGLPTHVQKWTVLKSPFVHKGAQENFARLRIKRLLQIKDTQPQVLEPFIKYIQRNLPGGVGLRIHRFEYLSLQDAQRTVKEAQAKSTVASEQQPLSFHHIKQVADKVVAYMEQHPGSNIDQVTRKFIEEVYPAAAPPKLLDPKAFQKAQSQFTRADKNKMTRP